MYGKEESTALIERPPAAVAKVKSRAKVTQIIVRHDCGFGNTLFIRGSGAGLSWNKGVALKNLKADEWLFETTDQFDSCEFKILVNDQHYEEGNNHTIGWGKTEVITPQWG